MYFMPRPMWSVGQEPLQEVPACAAALACSLVALIAETEKATSASRAGMRGSYLSG